MERDNSVKDLVTFITISAIAYKVITKIIYHDITSYADSINYTNCNSNFEKQAKYASYIYDVQRNATKKSRIAKISKIKAIKELRQLGMDWLTVWFIMCPYVFKQATDIIYTKKDGMKLLTRMQTLSYKEYILYTFGLKRLNLAELCCIEAKEKKKSSLNNFVGRKYITLK